MIDFIYKPEIDEFCRDAMHRVSTEKLFYRNRFSQVSWLIHITTAHYRYMIRY